MKRIPPALFLIFLAPMIGELLSGSAPPVEFFNPFSLLILSALYGSGAVLARELALRWNKRWPTILTLGLAYGVIEEGLMVKSFFDPNWMDLGILGTYGRLVGVNWVWSVSLTLYHATVSIAIPILLTELIFADRRDEPWTSRRGVTRLSILLAAVVLFGALAMAPYRPPFVPYLFAIIATVVYTSWLGACLNASPRRIWLHAGVRFGSVCSGFFPSQLSLSAAGRCPNWASRLC